VQRFPFIDLLLAQKRTHYALLPGQLSGPGSPIHLAAGLLNINFSRCRAKKMPLDGAHKTIRPADAHKKSRLFFATRIFLNRYVYSGYK